jgi:hypothetical protein
MPPMTVLADLEDFITDHRSHYEKQARPVTWIVTAQKNQARVTDVQGNVGDYLITKVDASGITLVEAQPGASVQVITIDPITSSFVYTTQGSWPLWNRANTLVGTCE